MKKLIVLLTTMSLMIGIAKAQVPSYVPTNGLVGWWPFNGNANDESGNGNHGTAMNGVAMTLDRNGNPNSAISTSLGYITCPVNNIPTSGLMTISFWLKEDSDFMLGEAICLGSASNTTWGCVVGNNAYTLNYGRGCGSTGSSLANINNDSSWHNIVFVSSGLGASTQVYRDGMYITTTVNANSNGCSNSTLYLGVDMFTMPEFFYGSLDDIGIWNRALDSCEIKDLYFASLGNCCSAAFNTQPQSVNTSTGSNASFIAQSSSLNAIYQWQSNAGSVWQNLSNTGQYYGVNNDTLSVTNLSAANNNQLFRCILTSGTCTDTSATATLSVTATNGVYQLQSQSINIYPNPASNQINIVSNASRYPVGYKILNEVGQTILIGELKSNNTSLDISNLATGNYMLVVGTKHLRFVKNK